MSNKNANVNNSGDITFNSNSENVAKDVNVVIGSGDVTENVYGSENVGEDVNVVIGSGDVTENVYGSENVAKDVIYGNVAKDLMYGNAGEDLISVSEDVAENVNLFADSVKILRNNEINTPNNTYNPSLNIKTEQGGDDLSSYSGSGIGSSEVAPILSSFASTKGKTVGGKINLNEVDNLSNLREIEFEKYFVSARLKTYFRGIIVSAFIVLIGLSGYFVSQTDNFPLKSDIRVTFKRVSLSLLGFGIPFVFTMSGQYWNSKEKLDRLSSILKVCS